MYICTAVPVQTPVRCVHASPSAQVCPKVKGLAVAVVVVVVVAAAAQANVLRIYVVTPHQGS